jgi:hypothetical protein
VISRLLAHWREKVWGHALELLEVPDATARASRIEQYEKEVLELGEIIII